MSHTFSLVNAIASEYADHSRDTLAPTSVNTIHADMHASHLQGIDDSFTGIFVKAVDGSLRNVRGCLPPKRQMGGRSGKGGRHNHIDSTMNHASAKVMPQ